MKPWRAAAHEPVRCCPIWASPYRPVMADAPRRSSSWVAHATALPGIAALGAATLYAAGLIARAGELAAAGFSPEEVLPWIPIQQGLARGAALLMDPPIVLAFLTFASGWIPLLLPDGPRTLAWRARRLREISEWAHAVAQAASAVEGAGHGEDVSNARRRLATVAELVVSPSNYDMDQCVRELRLGGHDVRAAAMRHGVGGIGVATLDAVLGDGKRPRKYPWFAWFVQGVGAIALIWLVLIVELAWLPASALIAAIAVGVYFERRRAGTTDVWWWKPAICCVLIVFVLGNAYLGATPLQRVELRLPSGKILRGQLLGGPGTQVGTWYVSPSRHEVVAVSDASVVRIRQSERPGRFDGYSLLDAIRGHPDNGQP